MHYILLNGCPAITVPVKVGAPLVAWDCLTLEELWKVELPSEDGSASASGRYEGIVDVLFEYLDLCIDWGRVVLQGAKEESGPREGEDGKTELKNGLKLLVAAAIRSQESKEAKKEIDKERSGIAMWRIP